MPDESDLVTVFRSLDLSAEPDAISIRDLLVSEGISAVLLDDSAPGVVEGTYEVRVPAQDSARAEDIVAEHSIEDESGDLDESPGLDLETVFNAQGPSAEMEAMSIRSVLEASGIAAVLVGSSYLPNLSFRVSVAKDLAEKALQIIAEAKLAGPAAAEEAEQASE